MPWEKGQRGTKYFTRTVRRNGRDVRIYYGQGPEAEAAAREVEKGHKQRQAWRETKQKVAAVEAAMEAFTGQCDGLLVAAMLAAGRHSRKGEWRKRRD